LTLVKDAVAGGARQHIACRELGISVRTIERWRQVPTVDRRCERAVAPTNKLSNEEREDIVQIATSKEMRDLSPNQIVPLLADQGIYKASERTFYRVLKAEKLLAHRGKPKPPMRRRPTGYVATGPNQVYSWDITYLKAPICGTFFYLYMFVDVWSRKVVGYEVHEVEDAGLSADLFKRICSDENIDPKGLVLHADNGGPMRGSTMVATLEKLGVSASFSRPHVSDDNPYSKALFRTLKYRPGYPDKPFASLNAARNWVTAFVAWYNDVHLHSAIRFVTPSDRHAGRDKEKLAKRHAVYTAAKAKSPLRWSGKTRNWQQPHVVWLNPPKVIVNSSGRSDGATQPIDVERRAA